jgi:spermidine/putrescine transport system substrate-binding protein
MTPYRDEIRMLAPSAERKRMDTVALAARNTYGGRYTRAELLGLAGLGGLALAFPGTASAAVRAAPIENDPVIYNWAQYDNPSTYTNFKKAHPGLKLTETYYSSNDELIAKLNAGGGSGYDIVVPSQNAVAELIALGQAMPLQMNLLPNIKNMDPSWLKPSFDPTGKYSVVKDYGVTGFFYNNKIVTEQPKSMLDFYKLLPKYVKKGRTNIMDGAEEVVPIALMANGMDPNTGDPKVLAEILKFLLSIRKGVTTITSSDYINDGSAGKIVLGQGWNGDMRRIREARKKQGDITVVLPSGHAERWADNWMILKNAKHPLAAHAWINNILSPKVAASEVEYHNYPVPIPSAMAMLPANLRNDPLVNVPKSVVSRYTFILNPSPAIVQARTKIYTEFKAA